MSRRCSFLPGLAAVLVLAWTAGPVWAGPRSVTPAAVPDAAPNTAVVAAEGPRWRCDQETHDLGPVFEGEIFTRSFVFSNPGTVPLEIREVKPACGCTQTGAYDRRIAPGGSGSLTFRFDTRHMHGAVRRTILVRTNAVDRPEVNLWLQAQVAPSFEVIPPAVEFGVLDPAQPPVRRRVHILNQRPDPVRLTAPAEDPAFLTGWRELKAGREFELSVEVRPDPAPGTYSTRLRILPEGRDVPHILIPVSAYVPSVVDVRPRAIVLGTQPLTGPMERVVSVRYTRAGTLTLKDLRTGLEGVTARLLDPAPNKRFRILVHFPAGYGPPPTGAALTFATSDPDFPRISVPVLQEPAPTPVATGGRP